MSLRAICRSGERGAVETGSPDTSSFVAYAGGWVDGPAREAGQADDEGFGVFGLEAITEGILTVG